MRTNHRRRTSGGGSGRLGTAVKAILTTLCLAALLATGTIGGCGQAGVSTLPTAIDVRLYGANPNDNVADDAAIQAAINAAGNYGKVIFPPMTIDPLPTSPGLYPKAGPGYLLTSGVECLRDDIEIDAAAARFTVTMPSGGTGLSFGASYLVSDASNAAPIVITTTRAHNLLTGDYVTVCNVAGNTAANVSQRITRLSSTTFALDGTTGNGAYTSGGNVLHTVRHQRVRIGSILYKSSNSNTPSPFDAATDPYPVSSSNAEGWTSGTVGLNLENCHSGEYEVQLIAGFAKGCYAHAYGQDAHHCKVKLEEVRSNKTGVLIYTDGPDASHPGFENGWRWSGGRWGFISSDPSGGRYCLELNRSSLSAGQRIYDHRFRDIQIESPTVGSMGVNNPMGGILLNCEQCVFEVGFDITDFPTVPAVDMRTASIGAGVYGDHKLNGGNLFVMGNTVAKPSDFTADDANQRIVKMIGRNTSVLMGGNATNPTLQLRTGEAYSDKVLSFEGVNGTEAAWVRACGFLKLGGGTATAVPGGGGTNAPTISASNPAELFYNTSTLLVEATDTANRYAVTHCLFSSSTNASNSTTGETSIVGTSNAQGSKTIQAGTFDKIGRTIHIKAAGYVASGSGTQTDSVNVRIKYGSTVIGETDAISLTNGTTPLGWVLDCMITCRTTGASGTLMTTGTLSFPANTSGSKLSNATSGDRTTYQIANTTPFTADTVDLTASGTLDVVAPWTTGALLGMTGVHTNYTIER